jgi:hypothetical protein
MTASARSLLRYAAGLILALLLGDSLSPAALGATCGEHVRFSKGDIQEGQSLDSESSLPPAPLPCIGQVCSSQEVPAPIPVVPPLTDSDSWGCLIAVPAVSPCGPGRAVRHGNVLPLRPTPASIFHPPRL